MPEDVDACVQSVLDDNPDMDESTAFAICNSMKDKGQLAEFTDLLSEPPGETATLAQFRNPGDIQRVEENGGVRYKRVMLLSPGTWTDAGSEQTVDYSADGIRASAENWVDIETLKARLPDWGRMPNAARVQALRDAGDAVLADEVPINFLHGPSLYGAESLDSVGHIPTESVIVDDRGRLYADLVFHQDSPQSETAVQLMDEVLEAAQVPGAQTPPVGPSVEIPADDVEPSGSGVHELQEAWFSATGVVFNPASRPVELGTQAAERAVAMTAAESDADTQGVIYRSLRGEAAVHEPDWGGKPLTGAPEEFPSMDDFDTDDLGTISDHALASTSGFPPDDFDDILGFVVTTDGDLSLPLMREVAASIAQANLGDESTFMARLSREQRGEASAILEELAERNFGAVIDPAQGESESESGDGDAVGDEPDGEADADADAGEDTIMALPRHRRHMSEAHGDDIDWSEKSAEELEKALTMMREDIDDVMKALQSPDEMQMVMELAAQFVDEMGEEASVAEMATWVEESTDVDVEQVSPVLEEYLADVEADSLEETPVNALQEWLSGELAEGGDDEDDEGDEAMDEADEDEEAPPTDGGEEGDGQALEEIQQAKATIGEIASHFDDIKDMLTAQREEMETLERRLAAIEDEPEPRSLASPSSDSFVPETDDRSNGDGGDGEHEELYL